MDSMSNPLLKWKNDESKETYRVELPNYPTEVTSTKYGEKIQHRYDLIMDNMGYTMFVSSKLLQGLLAKAFLQWHENNRKSEGSWGKHPLVEISKQGKDKDRVYNVRLLTMTEFCTVKS